jgi:guanine deaminase
MTPEKFMARAIEIGRAGLRTKDARPFAAVVVRQGKIVGEGRSQQKTLLDPTAHGEIVAIRDASAGHDRSERLRALYHL